MTANERNHMADLTDEQIVAIRDEHLPSQGDAFDCIAFARAVLRAQSAAPAVQGPPREPTPEMCTAGCKATPELYETLWLDMTADIWRAMYDAWAKAKGAES